MKPLSMIYGKPIVTNKIKYAWLPKKTYTGEYVWLDKYVEEKVQYVNRAIETRKGAIVPPGHISTRSLTMSQAIVEKILKN